MAKPPSVRGISTCQWQCPNQNASGASGAPWDSIAGLIISLQPRDGEMGTSPDGKAGRGSSCSLWDFSAEGIKLPPWCTPSELVGLGDPEGPFCSYYWDFEIGGGKNLSKIRTNLGNGFHLWLRTLVSFLYIISFIHHSHPVRCGHEFHLTPGSKELNNLNCTASRWQSLS